MPAPKPISKDMITNGMQYARSMRSLARYLGCSYLHLRQYMHLYKDEDGVSFYDKYKNQNGKGVTKLRNRGHSEKKIAEILKGGSGWETMHPNKFVQESIRYGYFQEECVKCGMKERRMLDYKVPLLLNFKDSNKNNFKLDNLELVCYNCYFLYIGDVFDMKQQRAIQSKQDTHTKAVDFDLDDEYWEKMKSDIEKESEKLQSYGSDLIARL